MGGRRVALLVATDRYQDSGLSKLAAPASDARRLAAVLSDVNIAGFEVRRLYNRQHHVVGRAIGDFYRNRKRDDLTLLYFTRHGVKDEASNLYLAMTDTDRGNLQFTGVQAEQIKAAMDGCLSRQKILVLDCCYAGAFPAGLGAKGDSEVHALEQLAGRGCVVLTSSDAMQLSFEGDQVKKTGTAALMSGPSSLFTRFLIEGLRTGKADLDGDGDITLDELYSYVYDRVTREQPLQRPKIKEDAEGRIRVAQNVNWTLPSRISDVISSPYASAKLSALDDLRALYNGGNAIVKERVLEAVRTLDGDDSRSVSEAAHSFLSQLAPEKESPQAGEQAERNAQEAARREAAAQKTASREAEEQAARGAASREAQEQAAREAASREAEEQATRDAAGPEAEAADGQHRRAVWTRLAKSRAVWAVAAALAVAGIIAGVLVSQSAGPPTAAKPPPSTSQPARQPTSSSLSFTGSRLAMGQSANVTVESQGVQFGAATLTVSGLQVTKQAGSSGLFAPKNGYFVYVNVKAVVTGADFSIDRADFYALVNGNQYNWTSGDAMFVSKDNFARGTLQPGQTTSGQIAFDVPAQHGIIIYSPSDGSGPLVGWSF